MTASYPASAYTWTDRVNNVDDVMAADVNSLAAEIDAIEADLVGTLGTAGGLKQAAASFYANWTAEHNTTGTHKAVNATSIALGGGTALTNYVENTYAPTVTLVGGVGNTVPVYITNTGRYTRIGRLCFIDVYLTGDGGNEGAGTGVYTVALPIAASASNPTGYVPIGYFVNGTAEYPIMGWIAPSATTVDFAYQDVLNNFTVMTGAEQNNITRTVRLKCCYEV